MGKDGYFTEDEVQELFMDKKSKPKKSDTYYAVFSDYDDMFVTPLCDDLESLALYIEEDGLDTSDTVHDECCQIMKVEVVQGYSIESQIFLCRAGKRV